MSVITLTKDNFKEEVVLYEGRVLLDFYADWCAPCRMLATAIDKGEIIQKSVGLIPQHMLDKIFDPV